MSPEQAALWKQRCREMAEFDEQRHAAKARARLRKGAIICIVADCVAPPFTKHRCKMHTLLMRQAGRARRRLKGSNAGRPQLAEDVRGKWVPS